MSVDGDAISGEVGCLAGGCLAGGCLAGGCLAGGAGADGCGGSGGASRRGVSVDGDAMSEWVGGPGHGRTFGADPVETPCQGEAV